MQSWIHVLEWRATVHPDVLALADDRGARYTYGELRADRAGAAHMVSQRVADAFVAHGDAAAIARRLTEYRAAGVDLPVIFPMPVAGDWGYERAITALSSQVAADKEAPRPFLS
jgi:hypothetical protein